MDTASLSDNCNSTLPLAKATADKFAEEFDYTEWYVVKHGRLYYSVSESYFINHPNTAKLYRGQKKEETSHGEAARFLPLADGVGKEDGATG